jgi:hypothetical protein
MGGRGRVHQAGVMQRVVPGNTLPFIVHSTADASLTPCCSLPSRRACAVGCVAAQRAVDTAVLCTLLPAPRDSGSNLVRQRAAACPDAPHALLLFTSPRRACCP